MFAMPGFYLSPFTTGFLAFLIIFTILVGFTLTVKNRSKATNYFMLFLLSVFFVMLVFLLLLSTVDSVVARFLWRFLHQFVFGSVFFLAFCYEFGENIYKKESKIVIRISLVASVLALIQYIYATEFLEPVFVMEAYFYTYVGLVVPGIVIGTQMGWGLLVLLRKSAHFSTYEYKVSNKSRGFLKRNLYNLYSSILKIKHADTKISQGSRSFALFFLAVVPVLIIAILLAYINVFSWNIIIFLISIGILSIFMFLFIILLNHSPESSSFMVKLVGMAVQILLVVVGIFGNISIQEGEKIFHQSNMNLMAEFLKGRNVDFEKGPDAVKYIVKFTDQNFDEQILFNNTLLNLNKLFHSKHQVKIKNDIYYRKGNDINPEKFYIGYRINVENDLYEVGFSYLDYREILHQQTLPVILIILFSSLITLIFLPIFYQVSLIRPLTLLLDGVRKVNEGDLGVNVPVIVEDEFGFLARSFNKMVISIREANRRLSDYAEHLEKMVKERTKELTLAKKETDTIMQHVVEGLFLVYKTESGFAIGNQYSNMLEYVLGDNDLGGKNLLDYISKYTDDETLENSEKFLSLMFNPRMDEDSLKELNPLKQVGFIDRNYKNSRSEKVIREIFLKFNFNRIEIDGNIPYLMGTAADVTEQVMLAKQLEESRIKAQTQTERLFKILHIDASLLKEFIEGSAREIDAIDGIFKRDSTNDLRERLVELYRNVHTIKGNASVLELDFISEVAHSFEDAITILQKQKNISGENFVILTVLFQRLTEMFNESSALLAKLLNFRTEFGDEKQDARILISRNLEKTVSRLADRLGKKVELDLSRFDIRQIPDKYKKDINDILNQLIRNSVSHGIEFPEEREAVSKNPVGKVSVEILQNNERVNLIVKDDGRGMQLDKIRKIAVAKGLLAENIAIDDASLARLIFKSGLSTNENVDEISGRGVGMDIVYNKINLLNGEINIDFLSGQFSCFVIKLPL